MKNRIGEELGVSRWFTIDQPRIDAFADLTEDHQFIHTDPARAAATPFGTTIAHGFLTLSMLSAMAYDGQPEVEGQTMGINYGFERIRFLSPVPSGARIRARFTLAELTEKRPGDVTLAWDVTMEAEGATKPVVVARWLNKKYMEAA
ncbi:MaoC family dehydratase [Oceanicola sp. 502str15]|uniref:MaoC family dehydratase n=1 Tax=Oceanicola sp. 502str15 TaxID=2696061 RepID=UPI0020954A1F|nr:MaoC family dehydratase [Oceanicola sp. 502str15]MCO6381547.1 MaoC family dehydratase [Oceanicola sp. 502str15]